jgi:hypothetical protein
MLPGFLYAWYQRRPKREGSTVINRFNFWCSCRINVVVALGLVYAQRPHARELSAPHSTARRARHGDVAGPSYGSGRTVLRSAPGV